MLRGLVGWLQVRLWHVCRAGLLSSATPSPKPPTTQHDTKESPFLDALRSAMSFSGTYDDVSPCSRRGFGLRTRHRDGVMQAEQLHAAP
jgi:hypothetical protein